MVNCASYQYRETTIDTSRAEQEQETHPPLKTMFKWSRLPWHVTIPIPHVIVCWIYQLAIVVSILCNTVLGEKLSRLQTFTSHSKADGFTQILVFAQYLA